MKYSEILGCTLPELREHIESQFEEGMNLEEYRHSKKEITLITLKTYTQYGKCNYRING